MNKIEEYAKFDVAICPKHYNNVDIIVDGKRVIVYNYSVQTVVENDKKELVLRLDIPIEFVNLKTK